MTSVSWSKLTTAVAIGAVAILAVAPTGWGFPTGADKEKVTLPDFATKGCTACHGGGKFAAGGTDLVRWTIAADGVGLAGNTYEAGKEYTIAITLDKKNVVEGAAADRKAGFNLRASAGKLAGVDGVSQVTADGTQATHVDAAKTSWDVTWTAPAAGVVVFDLFVNDVNGINGADGGDNVHRVGFWLTDATAAVPGAAAGEHEVHYGISLQQYWIGLIGLAGMVFIMVAGYVFLKYGSRHNTDAKDR